MKFFNLIFISLFLVSCSMSSDDENRTEQEALSKSRSTVVLTDLKLSSYSEKKFETSNTPETKFFHMLACFEKRLPSRKLESEDWNIEGFGKRVFRADSKGCVAWVETVKMDYSQSVGTFLQTREFKRVNSGETITVNMHIDQYKNKVTRGIGTLDNPDSSSSTEGLVVQNPLGTGSTLASDPVRETGDIQVLSPQDGHLPMITYRISLQIPNRIANIYERLQGEPIQVRLERADEQNEVYVPVKELEGHTIRSAPYGATNVAFDLKYNRYSPMRWIPYKLHIMPLNPAFKKKGLTLDLCIKPWEGQRYNVYDASTFGSCPQPQDKSLIGKAPEIYFNHVSFKQLGQVDKGYKMDEYLDISLRKRWRLTVRPYVNYWHNFESNNHYFPLLSGNFKIKMILMAYNKGDTLELTPQDLRDKNFDIVGYAETNARINKGNLIGDLSLDFPFHKWYRVYTRTFAAIQIVPMDEKENPFLKSGMAIIPFHAADRDYSIYVKTDHFTDILDPTVNNSKLNAENFADQAADMEMGSPSTIRTLDKETTIPVAPLTEKQSEESKGNVVFQKIEHDFFLDTEKESLIKNKLLTFFEDPVSFESLEVGSGERYNLNPEKTALEILNSSPVYKPMERYFVDTKPGRKKVVDFFATFLQQEFERMPMVGAAAMYGFALPPVTYDESNYKKIDYAKWATEGLDANAKKIFCHFYMRSSGAHMEMKEDGTPSKFKKSSIYQKCLEKPEVFIHVDNVSYMQKLNDYKFTMGMEIHHGLDRRVYLFNSYNDRESMSGRVNFAVGFEKSNLGAMATLGPMAALGASPVGRVVKGTLGLFNANFGGYDVGRYWGLDHSIGLSENVSKSESVSLTGTKHDVVFNADVRKCALVRFKTPEEIATGFTYYDRADFVSFSNMMKHQMGTISLWLGIDLGSRKTPVEQFQEVGYSLSERQKKFFETIMRRFEFCESNVSKNEKISESWYYLGSDLGYHSGTLDPLSIRHNPFMKLVRGTKNFDEVIDHLSHAIEAVFIEEAKNFEPKDNIGNLVKRIYKTPKYGYPPSMGKELIDMVGLPGMIRRTVKTDNPYYRQALNIQETFGGKGKITLGEEGEIIQVEKKEDNSWF